MNQSPSKTAENFEKREIRGLSRPGDIDVPDWVTESNGTPSEFQSKPVSAASSGTHPRFGRWYRNSKGYPVMSGGPNRKRYLHRLVWEDVAGRKIREGFHIHHMNGKGCICPWNLVEIQACLHPAKTIRDPYTGEFLGPEEYNRKYRDFY